MTIIPKHIEPKIRFMITVAILATILCLFGFVIFYYALPTIFKESARIEKTKAKLATLEEKKGSLLAEEEKTKALSTNLDAIETAIIPENNPIAFLGVLERLAKHEHLTIEIIPVTRTPDAPPDMLTLNVSVKGAVKQGIGFIKNISNLPFVITVSDVALSRNIANIPAETKSGAKTTTPTLGEATLTMTLLVASHP